MRHARRTARRNPRAPTTPEHPTVVLVRRFDPSGEELSRWEVLVRDADGDVAFLSPPQAKAAALAPPSDADIHIGDLIVTVPAEALSGIEEHATGLYVVAPDGVKAAPEPPEDLGGPWLARWGQDALAMLLVSSAVNRKRLVAAACDCAETMLHLVSAGEDTPRKSIETARAWCSGNASREAAAAAANIAHHEAYYARENSYARTIGSAARNASYHAAYAAGNAAKAAEVGSPSRAASKASLAAQEAAYALEASNGAPRETTYRALAPLVERWIPLPVVLLSTLGYPDAIPFDPSVVPFDPSAVLAEDTLPCLPRENPRSRPRRRSRR